MAELVRSPRAIADAIICDLLDLVNDADYQALPSTLQRVKRQETVLETLDFEGVQFALRATNARYRQHDGDPQRCLCQMSPDGGRLTIVCPVHDAR